MVGSGNIEPGFAAADEGVGDDGGEDNSAGYERRLQPFGAWLRRWRFVASLLLLTFYGCGLLRGVAGGGRSLRRLHSDGALGGRGGVAAEHCGGEYTGIGRTVFGTVFKCRKERVDYGIADAEVAQFIAHIIDV